MKKALGYSFGLLTQGLLYFVIFRFLVREGIDASTYYWTTFLGGIVIGYLTKEFFGHIGAIGNISALALAVTYMAWKYASVDALWLIGVMFFILLHAIEVFIWYSAFKQRSIQSR